MCAVTIATHAERDLLLSTCYIDGLIILGCGDSSIRFRPALNTTPELIDEGMAIIRRAIRHMRGEQDDAAFIEQDAVTRNE
jgi:L-lysine 6-transaminase